MHEMGHLLGFADLDPEEEPHDLMAATLAPGVRRVPAASDDIQVTDSAHGVLVPSIEIPTLKFPIGPAVPRKSDLEGSPLASWAPYLPAELDDLTWAGILVDNGHLPQANNAPTAVASASALTAPARPLASGIGPVPTPRDEADVSLWFEDDVALGSRHERGIRPRGK